MKIISFRKIKDEQAELGWVEEMHPLLEEAENRALEALSRSRLVHSGNDLSRASKEFANQFAHLAGQRILKELFGIRRLHPSLLDVNMTLKKLGRKGPIAVVLIKNLQIELCQQYIEIVLDRHNNGKTNRKC